MNEDDADIGIFGLRRRHALLMAILAGSLLLKLAAWGVVLSGDPGRFLMSDSPGYHDPARALLHTGTYAVSPDVPGVPETIRTPGYPLFLAGVYALFGEHYAAAIAAQILLSLATIALVYAMAARLWDARVGLLAALLLALDVASFSHALLLLSETLFTLLIVAMLAAGVRLLQGTEDALRDRLKQAALLGLFLALATMTRPVSYYLVVPLGVGALVVGARRWGGRTALAVLGLVVLPVALVAGGWQVRNYRLTGSSALSQIEGVNMLFYRAAAVVALRDGVSLHEARRRLAGGDKNELIHRAHLHPEARLGDQWKREGLAVLRSHPGLLLKTQAAGLAGLLAGPGEGALVRLLGGSARTEGPLGDVRRLSFGAYVQKWVVGAPLAFLAFVFAAAHLVLVYAAALPGLVGAARSRRIAGVHLLLWGVLLYLVVVSAGPEAYFRFRVPVMPILAMYAAAGLFAFGRKEAAPRSRSRAKPRGVFRIGSKPDQA